MHKTDYIICPVRNATFQEKQILDAYVAKLEAKGRLVHYPPRDVEQEHDPIGLKILGKHREAMRNCQLVHLFFNPASQGSLFDCGMAYVLGKPIVLINSEQVMREAVLGQKCFANVFLVLDSQARELPEVKKLDL